jgi:hypothetical protein
MSRPELKAGGTKLAFIDHLTLHIYCACGHYAELEVADNTPTMGPEATVADVLLSRKCSKCGTKVPPQVRIIYSN